MRLSLRTRFSVALVASILLASTAVADGLLVNGTDGDDVLTGTAAAESFYGRAGNDTLSGGGGDDEFDGGPGADSFSGNEGSDAVSYSGAAPVTVTIDGVANDGAVGEADNVGLDIEDVFGGAGNDRLTGSPAANTLDGGNGDDRLDGGNGTDFLFGGEGDDVIFARDGEVDVIECGPGLDTATVDRDDIVAGDCESISRPQITSTPGLTLNGPKRKLIVSTIESKSSLKLVCLTCGKKKTPKLMISKDSVKLSKGRVAVFGLSARLKNKTIELGVREPGASPICVVYKVDSRFRYKVLKAKACTSVAREF
jgi:hypothetical protein